MHIRVCFRYGDRRLFARLVTLVQGSDTAHCEAARAWTGDVHECVSSSWLDGGVRGKTIEMPAGKWRIYEVDAAIDPLVYLSQHDGDGYDWLGLLGFVIRTSAASAAGDSAARRWPRSWACATRGASTPRRWRPWSPASAGECNDA